LLAALVVMFAQLPVSATPGYVSVDDITIQWDVAYNNTTDIVSYNIVWSGMPTSNGSAEADFTIHPCYIFYTDSAGTIPWNEVYGSGGVYDAVGNILWQQSITWATHAMTYGWEWDTSNASYDGTTHYFNSHLTWALNSAVIPRHYVLVWDGIPPYMYHYDAIYPATYRVAYHVDTKCCDNNRNWGDPFSFFSEDKLRPCPQGHD
jgi:hypothetical protein